METSMRVIAFLGLGGMFAAAVAGQVPQSRPPVIDVHVHSTTTSPKNIAQLESLNVRYWVLSGLNADLRDWQSVDAGRFLPSLVFPCDHGRAPITGRPCFDTETDLPNVMWLREQLRTGRIKGFGEMSPQYLGISPADARLEPYWQLAEEFDIPVGLHMGPGPAGAAYDSNPVPFKSPAFRMAFGDPILLEEVLLRHKRLRLYVMHAGWPQVESMAALLYAHPNVYVDVAALSSERIVPRAGYYRHLRALVENGFATRIMFGSDFPDQVGPGIDAIQRADFLTAEQKADILCNNAARFLRLDGAVCQR
jgi:uncharacterized protein